jgi:hypothetical protein
MLEGKKGHVSFYVAPTKAVPDCAVSICFPLEINGCAFARLLNGCSCGTECFPHKSEEACLAYSLFINVKQALCGDPTAMFKSKVSYVKCGAHNGMFYINWNTKGTTSAVRKSIGIACKSLNPARVNPIYTRVVRELGGQYKKETFAYVADSISKSMKDLTIGIIGNIKMDKEKFDDMMETISKKISTDATFSDKVKPANHTECDHSSCTELKVSGWASSAVVDYLQFKVKGITPTVCDKTILLNMKPAVWETLSKKLKDGVSDFVKAKYSRLGDNLGAVFGYLILSNGSACASDAKQALKSTEDSIGSAIMKIL